MGRRLFNLAAGVSLVLCVAVVLLSFHSNGTEEEFGHFSSNSVWCVGVTWGEAYFEGGNRTYAQQYWFWEHSKPPRVFGETLGGFDYQKSVGHYRVLIPLWVLWLFASILPICWLLKAYRTWKRIVEGRCLACGYDLRATPDRCPECGTLKR
ncbi:MAG TPA: hypothetical protein VHD56_11355 [Tepidisphaeraceae bacterium]|nr:hypothetical protein [Tepidisphaeraceae bacterium]